jgi:hypothetical protein
MHPQTFFTRLSSREADHETLDMLKEKPDKNWYADRKRGSATFIPDIPIFSPDYIRKNPMYQSVDHV